MARNKPTVYTEKELLNLAGVTSQDISNKLDLSLVESAINDILAKQVAGVAKKSLDKAVANFKSDMPAIVNSLRSSIMSSPIQQVKTYTPDPAFANKMKAYILNATEQLKKIAPLGSPVGYSSLSRGQKIIPDDFSEIMSRSILASARNFKEEKNYSINPNYSRGVVGSGVSTSAYEQEVARILSTYGNIPPSMVGHLAETLNTGRVPSTALVPVRQAPVIRPFTGGTINVLPLGTQIDVGPLGQNPRGYPALPSGPYPSVPLLPAKASVPSVIYSNPPQPTSPLLARLWGQRFNGQPEISVTPPLLQKFYNQNLPTETTASPIGKAIDSIKANFVGDLNNLQKSLSMDEIEKNLWSQIQPDLVAKEQAGYSVNDTKQKVRRVISPFVKGPLVDKLREVNRGVGNVIEDLKYEFTTGRAQVFQNGAQVITNDKMKLLLSTVVRDSTMMKVIDKINDPKVLEDIINAGVAKGGAGLGLGQVPGNEGFARELSNKDVLGAIKDRALITRMYKDASYISRKDVTATIGGMLNFTNATPEAVMDKVYALAQQFSPQLTPDTLKKVSTVPSGKGRSLTDMTFSFTDEQTNITEKATIAVDNYGNAIVKTRRQLMPFTDALASNIEEFVKWSIAVTAVLLPLQKMGELVQAAIETQERMADVLVSVGKATADAGRIFKDAYSISKQTGESINGVLEAYNTAYRATGNVADEQMRFAQTSKLMVDAITLAKISSLDEAEAIDTLAAVLRQVDTETTNTEGILNKWVRTSRYANVDVGSLATSFAILGDSAEASGLSIDELNGLVATIASTGLSSGKELGNTAKAVLSGFQSDKGSAELIKMGIALTDSTGKAREFKDIMNELSTARKTGVVGNDQFMDLTMALGGGARRQAVWASLISNWTDVNRVTSESEKATNSTGEASEALSTKMETVTTSVTQLSNAFISLAETLGTKGGILDSFSSIVNIGTSMIEILDKVLGLSGKMGPMITAIGGVALIMSILSDNKREDITNRVTSKINNAGAGIFTAYQRLVTPQYPEALIRQEIASGTYRDASGAIVTPPAGVSAKELAKQRYNEQTANAGIMNYGNAKGFLGKERSIGGVNVGAIGNYAVLVLPIISTLSDKNLTPQQKSTNVAAELIGGSIGAAVGKSPMWAIVGATIAEAFVNGVVEARGAFETAGAALYANPQDLTTPLNEAQQKKVDSLLKQYMGYSGGGKAETAEWETNLFYLVNSALASSKYKEPIGGTAATGRDILLRQLKDTAQGYQYLGQNKVEVTENQKKEAQDILTEINKIFEEKNPLLSETLTSSQKELQTKYANQIASAKNAISDQMLNNLITGSMTTGSYKKGIENLGYFDVRASKFLNVFQNPMAKAGITDQQLINRTATVSAFTSTDELTQLDALINDYLTANNSLSTLTKGTEEYASAQEDANLKLQQAINLFNLLYNQAMTVQPKTMVDLSEYSRSESDMILAKAKEIQRKNNLAQIQAGLLTQEQVNAYTATLAPFGVKDKLGAFSQQGYESGNIQEAINQLIKAGSLQDKISQMGFDTFNISYEDFQAKVLAAYPALAKRLESAGVDLNPEDTVGIFEGGKIEPVLKKDMRIIQYLLSQILETEQKQLETSIYNFPEGMFPVVPFYGYMKGMTEGTDNIIPGGTTPSTTPLSEIDRGESPYPEAPYSGNVDTRLIRNRTSWKEISKLYGPTRPLSKIDDPAYQQMMSTKVPEVKATITINNNTTTTLKIDGKTLAELLSNQIAQRFLRFTSGANVY